MNIAVFYNLDFSGAKRTVFEHVKGLKRRGHRVDVYTLDTSMDIFHPGNIADAEYVYPYNPSGVPLPVIRKIVGDMHDFQTLKKIHKQIAYDIDKKMYDIALIHTDKLTQAPYLLQFLKTKNVYFCLEPLKIAYEYGLRLSDTFSSHQKWYESWNRYVRKKIDRENARAADATMAISYFGRELMIQSFDLYPTVSYLGVHTDVFINKNIPKKNQICFIGQKIDMNGYQFALSAIKKIPEKIRPELAVLSISKDPKKRISDDEIVTLYNQSLMTFSLSNFDTFGLVPLESMACEVPVIAFNVAAYRETILDSQTGYLVEFDADAIAQKAIKLLIDANVRKNMGIKARKWVEDRWTWDKQITLLEKELKQLSEKV